MSHRGIQEMIDWLAKQGIASAEELGAIQACLIDVPEGFAKILDELLPQILKTNDDPERLLDHMVELYTELNHLGDHVADASTAVQKIAHGIAERLPSKSQEARHRRGQ
jgi:hypothetical protein